MPSIDGVDSHLDNDEDCLDAECLREENHVIQQGSSNPDSLAVNGIYGDIYKTILSQPSSSCLDDRRRSTLPERMIANRQLGKVHRKFVSSGKDLMNSISSSAGSKKSSDERAMDCVPACGYNYFSDDYVSLPLNSRGEFVNLHPGGSPSSVNISKRQCLGESSSHPSASPAFYNPTTSTDHVNLRPNHHAPKFYATDQSPHFTPTVPTEYQMDFRQLPCSKRMENCKYSIPSNKYPCTNQQDISAACFSSECMKCNNPHPKLLGMQSGCMRQDWEQNTQSTSETTVRLMGKTVTLGTSSMQCRDLNNESPGSCKQVQAKDHSFQGMYRKTFPQLFHREMADPASAFRIPHGKRELSENPSFFSADELRSELDTNSFRTNGYNEQPVLPAANNLYVQPATWCNKGELRQPIMPNQAQSSAEDMLLASMHRRNTQNVASVPCLNRRNSVRNFMEKIPAPYQPGYFTQKFSNMTQRNLTSSSLSGYAAVQNSTTQTKFTSLPPLPPSLAPSRIRSLDYAQHRGTNTSTFNPSIPAVHQTSRSGAPGNAMPRDERLKWAVMGSNVEGSGQLNQNGKRPAERDDAFLTSPKKACTASGKDSNLLSGQFCRSRFAGARPVDMPVGLSPRPGLGNRDARTTWSYPVSTVGPVKLKPGVRHIVEPSASVMEQSIPWAVNSVTPIAVSTSKIETQKAANSNHVWQ
ncbi:hypothetical protein QOZ80_5AG0366440 [Eleusine coracana subsp. coracana]|nr:hypothetical protein QOZ80_5AG0366440 [Eleusine coracana subsp. coracana]